MNHSNAFPITTAQPFTQIARIRVDRTAQDKAEREAAMKDLTPAELLEELADIEAAKAPFYVGATCQDDTWYVLGMKDQSGLRVKYPFMAAADLTPFEAVKASIWDMLWEAHSTGNDVALVAVEF